MIINVIFSDKERLLSCYLLQINVKFAKRCREFPGKDVTFWTEVVNVCYQMFVSFSVGVLGVELPW